ncbi:MAG: hypothetical protein HON32_00595 [Francisellaceae bacterium]|jgi:hypothetical protein|nr:hypothetical protein [Francisellaceae bacterium]MBT6538014.1 hypothetical protein [Francisellaceae bacterium]
MISSEEDSLDGLPQIEKPSFSGTAKLTRKVTRKTSLFITEKAALPRFEDTSTENSVFRDAHVSTVLDRPETEDKSVGKNPESGPKVLTLIKRGMTLYFYSATLEINFDMQDIMTALSRCEAESGINQLKFGQRDIANGRFKKAKISPILDAASLIQKRQFVELCNQLNIDFSTIPGQRNDEWRDVVRWLYHDLQLHTDFNITTHQNSWMVRGTRRIHVINPNDMQLAKESKLSIATTNRKAKIDIHETREFHAALEVMEGLPHTYLRHQDDNPVIVSTRSAFNAALSQCLPGTTLIIDGHWDGDNCDPEMYSNMGIWGNKTIRVHAKILAEEISCADDRIDHVILGACVTGVVNQSLILNERQISFKSEHVGYDMKRMLHKFPKLADFKERATFETTSSHDHPFETGSLAGLFIEYLQRLNIFTIAVTATPQIANLVSPKIHGRQQAKEIGFIGQPLLTMQDSLGTSSWLSEPTPWENKESSLNYRLSCTKSITWVLDLSLEMDSSKNCEHAERAKPHRKSAWQRRL